MTSKGPGWANPWHQDDPTEMPWRKVWHHYAAERDEQLSACGQWRYEVLIDHSLWSHPPDDAKLCKTCQRLATKEPANATP